MTAADPTGGGARRAAAAAIAEEALCEVFDPEVVAGLREDSPLAVLGLTPSDVVCIADAVASAARRRSLACEPGDGDLDDAVTVRDVIDVIDDMLAGGGR